MPCKRGAAGFTKLKTRSVHWGPMARSALLFVALLLGAGLAGCARDGGEAPLPSTETVPTRPQLPPLRFSGEVVDALSGSPVADAAVRVDLAFTRPCQRPGVVYQGWSVPVDGDGRYGPFEVARPRSDDVAFFLQVTAPGYSQNLTYVGPTIEQDLFHTVVLHPKASIVGTAPVGTIVALQDVRFPRLALADASGRFAFDDARVVEAHLVAATDVPVRLRVAAPAELTINASAARGWVLEGFTRGPTGAPLAADIVAWNGTRLHSAARSGENGFFALPLPPEPVSLLIEARTETGQYGGTKRVELSGPPALRETVVLRALC